MHILIIDGSRSVLQAITRFMDSGHQVTFFRSRELGFYVDDPDFDRIISRIQRVIEIPSTTDRAVVWEHASLLNSVEPIEVVLCLLDFCMEAAAHVAAKLGLPFASIASVELCRSKHKVRQLLDDKGIPSARWFLGNTPDEIRRGAGLLGFPIVVKPTSGAASLMASVVGDAEQLNGVLVEMESVRKRQPSTLDSQLDRGLLLEERLQGTMVSVELGVSHNNEHCLFMISGRRRRSDDETKEMGITMPARISSEDWAASAAYAQKVVDAVGLRSGIFHVEVMLTSGGPRLVEVNARLMGGGMPLLYNALTGDNIFDHLLALHAGKSVAPLNPFGFGGCANVRLESAVTLQRPVPGDVERVLGRAGLIGLDFGGLPSVGEWIHEGTAIARFAFKGKDAAEAESMAEKFGKELSEELRICAKA